VAVRGQAVNVEPVVLGCESLLSDRYESSRGCAYKCAVGHGGPLAASAANSASGVGWAANDWRISRPARDHMGKP
jgi:hypothetical protein